MRAWLRGEQGQDLVESALAFSVLLVLVVGMVDLGFVFRTNIGVINAANAAALRAAISESDAANVTALRGIALREGGLSRCETMALNSAVAWDDSGMFKQVTVTVNCQASGPLGFLHDIPISRSVVRRIAAL